jgi:quercetin dioxygenase-like cupin family protein
MSDQSSFYVNDLAAMVSEIPDDTIVSRTFHEDDRVKAILFGFAPGQELSEHTASQPAILHFLQGEADLVLGTEQKSAGPGTWVHMPARLPHSILAKSKTLMLLLLFQADTEK